MSPDVLIRQATPDDIPELLRHRRGMYEDMGYNDAEAMSRMVETCRPYLAAALANGTLHAWLACAGERVVAGGFVLVSPWPSHPYDGQCRRATILNMYTDPPFRRQGIARRLMQTMIDWCRQARVRAGRPACQRQGASAYTRAWGLNPPMKCD